MSRIGKQPVNIPNGVKASIQGSLVSIEGPGGKLNCTVGRGVSVSQQDGVLLVKMEEVTDRRLAKQIKANYGTARALINNMVIGVTKGWKRSLEMVGVGYSAALKGQVLEIAAGFSHPVEFKIPKELKLTVGKTTIDIQSADRDMMGVFAARVRKVRPPEPYLGKGIKYTEETIRRKAGKTGKK